MYETQVDKSGSRTGVSSAGAEREPKEDQLEYEIDLRLDIYARYSLCYVSCERFHSACLPISAAHLKVPHSSL